MVKNKIIISLLNLIFIANIFPTTESANKITIESWSSGNIVEVTSKADKEIILKSVNRLSFEKRKLRKTRIKYLISIEYENTCVQYKTDGVYISYAENDLYIECDDSIKKIFEDYTFN